ncbi:ATP-dependent RNA helicase ddx51 [Chamberlinius hualienensis]
MSALSTKRYFGDDHKSKKPITLDEIYRKANERKSQRCSSVPGAGSTLNMPSRVKSMTNERNGHTHVSNEVGIKNSHVSEEYASVKKDEINNSVSNVNGETVNKKRKIKKKKNKKNKKRKENNYANVNGNEAVKDDGYEAVKNDGNDVNNFAVIGERGDIQAMKVKRVLPEWLSNPEVISSDLHSNLVPVKKLPGLSNNLVTILKKNGIKNFFPVQSNIIPWLLENSCHDVYRPRDLCVSSATGSGKTLAYVIPIVQAIQDRVMCSIKALVVLPVKDLAIQVFKVFETFCADTGLKVGLAGGDKTLTYEQASLVRKGFRKYHSLVDILICTPGRLVDHIHCTPGFSLQDLRFIVIDEADRIMQLIKQKWLDEVEKCINGNEGNTVIPFAVSRLHEVRNMPQKLLFSATLSHNPEQLNDIKLFQPKLFTAVVKPDDDHRIVAEKSQQDAAFDYFGKYTTPKELEELYIPCSLCTKPLILLHLIHQLNYRFILVFTNTIESTQRLSLLLRTYGNINVCDLSSVLHIRKREEILHQFAKGLIDVIVCSDALSRGIDVENVRYVVSYDKPLFLKTYIHRAGRTARAGRHGTAITFLQEHEVNEFKSMIIEEKGSQISELTVTEEDIQPMENKYKEALEKVAAEVSDKSHKGRSK